MSKIIRLFLTAIYMYGVPMLVASVPYIVMSKTNTDAGVVLSIITYVLVFIVELVGSSDHLESYIIGG